MFFLLELRIMEIVYRKAVIEDLPAIVAFVDFWLTGGGKAGGIPGAGHDYFVRVGQHESYLKKYDVLLAGYMGAIVGWAVKTKKGVLIHMLIAATFRGQGIGSEMLRRIQPDVVRSKFDQSSGDPAGFYKKHGYVKQTGERVGKKKNIDIFVRPGGGENTGLRSQVKASEPAKEVVSDVRKVSAKRRRTIDVIAEKLGL